MSDLVEKPFGDISKIEDLRAYIGEIERVLVSMGEKIDLPLTHHFAKSVYGREMRLPKGMLIVGKIHKHQTLNIISGGDVSVLSQDGVVRVKAPYSFVSSPGAKRVIFAHEDATWTCVHGTEQTDLDKIEDEFIAKNYDEIVPIMKEINGGYLASSRTLDDVLKSTGYTHEQLRKISEYTGDLVPFPEPHPHVEVRPSSIEGRGMFALKTFTANEVLAASRLSGKRTPAGRFVNHSGQPNAKMVMLSNGDVNLVAEQEILEGQEVLTDYYFNYLNTRYEGEIK